MSRREPKSDANVDDGVDLSAGALDDGALEAPEDVELELEPEANEPAIEVIESDGEWVDVVTADGDSEASSDESASEPDASPPSPKRAKRTKKKPAASGVPARATRASNPATTSTLDQYLADVSRFPLLTREEETEVAKRWVDEGDIEAARTLVTSNLRFVVKVAYEFRNYDVKLVDLIQEGNIGLMKAVRKFNPDRGYRLISYAVWWIRAYMQNYIIKNWSMVKIGTTSKHRKMLFGSRKSREEVLGERGDESFLMGPLAQLTAGATTPSNVGIARRDFSLDAALDEDGRTSYVEMLRDTSSDAEAILGRQETHDLVTEAIESALESLNDRERFILENRMLSEEPMTLQEIGNEFGVTRERARQLESNLRKKLAKSISEASDQPRDLIIDM